MNNLPIKIFNYSRNPEGDEIPFEVANIFFELNNTDGDLGIHSLIDGEPWKSLEIEGEKLEGDELVSTARLRHVMPAPPDEIFVSGTLIDPDSVDCDEGPVPSVSRPVIISWNPVTESHPEIGKPGAIEVV